MSAGAAYQRVYRARQAAGKTCVSVELDADDIATLITARVLDPHQDHHSREALAAAVKAFLKISRYA